jgi:hypothetical protein
MQAKHPTHLKNPLKVPLTCLKKKKKTGLQFAQESKEENHKRQLKEIPSRQELQFVLSYNMKTYICGRFPAGNSAF